MKIKSFNPQKLICDKLKTMQGIQKTEALKKTLIYLIQNNDIKKGTEISVTELSGKCKFSRTTIANAFKELLTLGYLEAQASKPYRISDRYKITTNKAETFHRWTKSHFLQCKQDILYIHKLADYRMYSYLEPYFSSIQKIHSKEIILLCYVLSLRSEAEKEYRKAVTVLSFINPLVFPDIEAFYSDKENHNIAIEDYMDEYIGEERIRSEWYCKTSALSELQLLPFYQNRFEFPNTKENPLMLQDGEFDKNKFFLRFTSEIYNSRTEALEFLEAFMDTDVVSIKMRDFDFIYEPRDGLIRKDFLSLNPQLQPWVKETV
ncbi:MAG: hypothetical protein H7A25_10485 [Leptospiraceae bacterium]|nr:hypothetical protein [Leptospiraceae bacterium]